MKRLALLLICAISALTLVGLAFADNEMPQNSKEQPQNVGELKTAGYNRVPPPIYHPTPYYHGGHYHHGGRCFVATSAYNNPDHPNIAILQKFRDKQLATNEAGRAFISFYYQYGPQAAEFLDKHAYMKPAVRVCLLPIIGFAWVLNAIDSVGGG